MLSAAIVPEKATGGRYTGAYSIVYEVRPAGGPPFRAKAMEVMYFSEARENRLQAGQSVTVRFDPSDQTIVLVRVKAGQGTRDAEAERREREEALLRGR